MFRNSVYIIVWIVVLVLLIYHFPVVLGLFKAMANMIAKILTQVTNFM
jgi:putative flippase GtrA